MDLNLDFSVAGGLKSSSQITRRITEAWAGNNLFCLACAADRLHAEPNNTPVGDFVCPQCAAAYQLKGKDGEHGNRVANSAYQPKIDAIRENRMPNYAFLEFSRAAGTVANLFVVPGHFITGSVVLRRNPLKATARRAGWVGSHILLSKIPAEGRIAVVSEGVPIDREVVRANWRRFQFLKSDRRASGGWGADVLAAVRQLQSDTGQKDFTLQEFYARFGEGLAEQHPDNRNVNARIRRQLQLLRDNNILEFRGPGRYRIIG